MNNSRDKIKIFLSGFTDARCIKPNTVIQTKVKERLWLAFITDFQIRSSNGPVLFSIFDDARHNLMMKIVMITCQ